jgi:hypothetical protein
VIEELGDFQTATPKARRRRRRVRRRRKPRVPKRRYNPGATHDPLIRAARIAYRRRKRLASEPSTGG